MDLEQRLSQLQPGTPTYRTLELRLQAHRAGTTPEALAKQKSELRNAWEAGGGIEGARERLKWANNFLSKRQPH